jgi:hypothetical protein
MQQVVTPQAKIYKTHPKYTPTKLYKATSLHGLKKVGELVLMWHGYLNSTSVSICRIMEVIPDNTKAWDTLKCLIVNEKNHIN